MLIVKYVRYVVYCSLLSISSLLLFDYFYGNTVIRHPLLYNKKQSHLKYILIWTSFKKDRTFRFGEGQSSFINKSCSITSCYVTEDRNFFKNITDFDVILFHGPDISPSSLPEYRLPYQKYVYASMESSDIYPNCFSIFNDFFNITFTYKLNSDLYFGYIIIKNKEGKVIGPKQTMHWMDVKSMDPISDKLKEKLSTKRIAAAWFVSNCDVRSRRIILAKQIIRELENYNMTVDVYGECGFKRCPKADMTECLRKLERDYYFYFSFESSLSEDFVTEKLLHALQHYTVPVVYGGANYTRFMPNGIYLNAQRLPVHVLVKQMVNIINNKEIYYNFFKWHNHYSYHYQAETPETNSYCTFCEAINNKEFFNKISIYEYFTSWWNPSYMCFI